MKFFKIRFSLLCLFMSFPSLSFSQLEVLYTPDLAPEIDGVISVFDPWQAENWQEQLLLKEGSTDEIESKFQLLWDDDNLYLAVVIKDTTPNFDHGTIHENDCVEVYFHMAGGSVDGSEVPYDASTCQLRFPRGETLYSITGTASIVNGFRTDDNARYAVESDPEGWTLEVGFPISLLDQSETFDGENFMFEIHTSDNTGTKRTGMLCWQNNSDNQWRYVDTFSPVRLSTEEAINNTEYYIVDTASICMGEVYSWHGNDYTETGLYQVIYTSVSGGDSIHALDLTVVNHLLEESVTICPGESYEWRGQVLSSADVYYDSLQSVMGCDSVHSLNLMISEPLGPFEITGDTTADPSEMITYTAPYYEDGIDYNWFVENGQEYIRPTRNTVQIQWFSAGWGEVALSIENIDGCDSDTAKLVVNVGGVAALHEGLFNDVSVYPNPTQGSIKIEGLEHPAFYTVMDPIGKKVFDGIVDPGSAPIDLHSLKKGVYFIRIENGGVYKILKE